jgi:dolichol kinase
MPPRPLVPPVRRPPVTYSTEGRERAERLRMAVHMSMSLSVLYYLLPPDVLGVPKATGTIAVLLAAALLELARIRRGWTFSLFREYERHRPAAYFWIGMGCCLAVVFFPQRFAVLTICGVAFVDPLINTLRPRVGRARAGAAGAAAWTLLAAAIVAVAGLATPWWMLPRGGVAAAAGETNYGGGAATLMASPRAPGGRATLIPASATTGASRISGSMHLQMEARVAPSVKSTWWSWGSSSEAGRASSSAWARRRECPSPNHAASTASSERATPRSIHARGWREPRPRRFASPALPCRW